MLDTGLGFTLHADALLPHVPCTQVPKYTKRPSWLVFVFHYINTLAVHCRYEQLLSENPSSAHLKGRS